MDMITFPYESKNLNLTLVQRHRARQSEKEHPEIYYFFHEVRKHIERMITEHESDIMYVDYMLYDTIFEEQTINTTGVFGELYDALKEQGVRLDFIKRGEIKIKMW